MSDTKSKVETTKVENKIGKPKGSPKSGGRVKGTPNKASSQWTDILESREFSVADEAIGMFKDISTPPNIKFQILQFLAQYTTAAIKPRDNEEKINQEELNQPVSDILSLVSGNDDK